MEVKINLFIELTPLSQEYEIFFYRFFLMMFFIFQYENNVYLLINQLLMLYEAMDNCVIKKFCFLCVTSQ